MTRCDGRAREILLWPVYINEQASLIWIVGEYANKIENADELLSVSVETFTEESYSVRIPIVPRYFC